MLNTIPVIMLTGTVLGFLSGLGIGGGSLLILWLTLISGKDPATARVLNLLFFLPSAGIACGIRLRKGTLKIRPILPAIIAGCIFAAVGSWIGKRMDPQWLRKIFGIILIITAIRELRYRPRNAR